MVSKKLHRLVRSLHSKKYRKKENLFFVEGEKSTVELLQANFSIKTLIATPLFLNKHGKAIQQAIAKGKVGQTIESDANTLAELGSLKTNDAALAVVEIPAWDEEPETIQGWALALDAVNDPGNLGTIIRIADWYGISQIVCSEDTVDMFNPKVINASKGSFLRVQVYNTNLADWLVKQSAPAFGADLHGQDVHTFNFPGSGVLVMGSESHGISEEISQHLQGRLTIPAYGEAESLNVGVATAIICDNLRRLHPHLSVPK